MEGGKRNSSTEATWIKITQHWQDKLEMPTSAFVVRRNRSFRNRRQRRRRRRRKRKRRFRIDSTAGSALCIRGYLLFARVKINPRSVSDGWHIVNKEKRNRSENCYTWLWWRFKWNFLSPSVFRSKWKKRSKRRKHCTLAVVGGAKNFAAPQTPFPPAQDRQNLISWRWSLPAPTHPVWWRSMHALSSYRGNRHRPPARSPASPMHTGPQTGPITIHCAAKLSAQCKIIEVSPVWRLLAHRAY